KPGELLTLRVSIPSATAPESERVARMHQEILNKVAAIPGVTDASLTNSVTMDGSNNNDPIFVENITPVEGKMPPLRRYKYISPGFFKTMGRPMVAGRDFTWPDIYDKRNFILVSENLAKEFWPKPGDAVGKRIRQSSKAPWREIIGVVGNERDDGADRPA